MENFDNEKIDLYLQGQLSVEEQQVIKSRIAAEPDFAEAVALHELTIVGIEHFEMNNIRAEIQLLDNTLEKEGLFLTSEDLDAYLDKTATPAIQQTIEKRLKEEASFKAELELHQLTRAGIEKKETEATFKDLFGKIDKDLEQEGFFEQITPTTITTEAKEKPKAKVIRFPFQKLAIAASVALAIVASWWIFQPSTINPNIAYANHFTLLSNDLSEALTETGFVREPYYDILSAGMEAYDNQKVTPTDLPSGNDHSTKAIDLIRQYRTAAPPTDEFYLPATLYLAISHLAINQAEQAIPLLEQLSKQNFPQQATARWYLALSYLKTAQTERATPILQSLDQSKYSQQAKDILDVL